MPERQSNAATTDKNVFEVFADEINMQRIIGTLLKFTKGDWLIGRDGEECPEKELVAIMPGTRCTAGSTGETTTRSSRSWAF